jgi:transketolase
MEVRDKKMQFLEEMSNLIREDIIEMLFEAGSGHPAGALGMADIFSALYFHVLEHKPQEPSWANRDRLVLSNGHICPVYYSAMARAGYFPLKELLTLRKINSRLQGHPHRKSLPGVETSSGPLGSGLSQAIGIALAGKLDKKKYMVYCAMSDGELNCGNSWEAFMFAGKNKLSNLTAIIDRNNIQIDGYTEDVMPLEPLKEKLESFNWHVIEIDGHNIEQFIDATNEAKAIFEKPTVIIAHTIPGKGVSFMENEYSWHGKPPAKEEAENALQELGDLEDKIKSKRR